MTYVPGPPSPRSDAVWREFYRIASNLGNGGTGDSESIYLRDYSGTDSQRWQAAINDATCFQRIVGEANTIYEIDAEVSMYEKPVRLDLNYSTWIPAEGYTGYLLSINGCNRSNPDLYWHHPCLQEKPAYMSRTYKHWPQVRNGLFSGYFRERPCGGIIFRGGNSDVVLSDLFLADIAGTAIAVCDPDSSTGLDADNQYIQESLFRDIHVKNCGAIDKPSVLIGRNNNGNSNHNNLRWEWCSFVYGRDAEIVKIFNKNTSTTNGRIQEVQFANCFFHGNRSLSDPDGAGNSSPANADVVSIGRSDATGTTYRIRNIYFRDCRITEAEDGYAGVHIKQWVDVTFTGGQIVSGSAHAGVKLSNAGNVLIDSVLGFDNPNLVVIDGEFKNNGRLTIGSNPSKGLPQYLGPNLVFNASSWASVIDTTGHVVSVPISGDVLASDTLPESGVTLVYDTAEFEMLVRAWFLPSEALTADDTNYASIIIRPYNVNGTVRPTHTITTKTTASGGTGNWTANVKVDLKVPSNTLIPGALSFNINKTGDGVKIPSGILCFQFSRTVYV